MTKNDIKKLASENAVLQRLLQQKEKKIVSIKAKVNELNKKNKAISYKLERSKNKANELKTTLVEEQKKTFESS